MESPPARVEVLRGALVESAHAVDVAVADPEGLVRAHGEVEQPIFPRSAIKALQALALMEGGAADAFALEPSHLALVCASHSGEAMHVEGVAQMLGGIGLSEAALRCGAQPPRVRADREALLKAGERPRPIHNNCSGKHAGMLALAVHGGHESEGYVQPDHPVQRTIARTLAEVIGAPHTADNRAVDGCSVPTYAVPLAALATALARFGVADRYAPGRAAAARRLREACLAHPHMVAGTGRACTALMDTLAGRAFVKTGAEGVYVAALPELGLGVALKVRDGAGRAAEVAIASLLADLLALDLDAHPLVKALAVPPIRNWNGIDVGQLRFVP